MNSLETDYDNWDLSEESHCDRLGLMFCFYFYLQELQIQVRSLFGLSENDRMAKRRQTPCSRPLCICADFGAALAGANLLL